MIAKKLILLFTITCCISVGLLALMPQTGDPVKRITCPGGAAVKCKEGAKNITPGQSIETPLFSPFRI